MNKKLAAGVLSIVLLAGGATAAYGATDSATLDGIKALTQEMFGIQKDIVDKQLEANIITQEKADAMKKFIDQRIETSDKALAEGKVLSPGMGGKGMGGREIRGDAKMFTSEPMTPDQIKTWKAQAQTRLNAQVESMESNAKLTPAQIEKWRAAALAQLEVQEEAMANGAFVPGVMGKGMRGGDGCGAFGGRIAPTAPAAPSTTSLQ